jgi:cell division protease FtsH
MGRDFGTTRDFSEEFAADLDREVKKVVDERFEIAKKLLTTNRDLLDAIAKELLEKETLDDEEVSKIIAQVRGEDFLDEENRVEG